MEEEIEEKPAPRTWNGMPVYECALCKFDSLDEAKLEEHVNKVHVIEEPPAARTVVLTDRFGNPQEG